jgi:hypothetical protein
MDTRRFEVWLNQSERLSDRSAKDVVCRVRRASHFISIDSKMETVDLLHKMNKAEEFKILSTAVRSQLRRAVKLYRKYRGDA